MTRNFLHLYFSRGILSQVTVKSPMLLVQALLLCIDAAYVIQPHRRRYHRRQHDWRKTRLASFIGLMVHASRSSWPNNDSRGYQFNDGGMIRHRQEDEEEEEEEREK